ncbi:MAG: hypothetical protein R2681_02100 [Pyrinomonadaceae bacterium]
MKLKEGDPVLLILQNPREKVWGVLRELGQAGVFLRGIDLNSFEDFVLAISNEAPFYGLSEQFYPMWRVERVALDDMDGDIPSLEQQFYERTGMKITDL